MIIFLFILAVLALWAGCLTGVHESMVHVKPIDKMHQQDWYAGDSSFDWLNLVRQFDLGVRGHVWTKYYHAITTGMRAGILMLGFMLAHAHSWEPFALVLSLGWLAYEPAYQYARYGTFMDRNYPEHVNFLDVIDFHANKRIMTAVRVILVAIVIGVMV